MEIEAEMPLFSFLIYYNKIHSERQAIDKGLGFLYHNYNRVIKCQKVLLLFFIEDLTI